MSGHRLLDALEAAELIEWRGMVRKVTSGRIEASGPDTTVGELCRIGGAGMLAEVAAVDEQGIVLVPLEGATPARLGACVTQVADGGGVGVGNSYAGRAIDALGRPLDGRGQIVPDRHVPLRGTTPGALARVASDRIVETGIRAVDALLTLGEGQRIGVFAASGVGKTSLIDQIALATPTTRCILCLVGERGREVEGFWRTFSNREDAHRFTVIAATSDESAAMRARSVGVALFLAGHWREQGGHVLLIVVSVTRLAMALREIGLAAGEPPTVRAYTPNVFAALPRVVERCGAVSGDGMRDGGAITAVMTVLSETDDVDDPIVETMKSLLDGHIVLSRSLAERGHFPAIDITRSVSRQATRLMSRGHAAAARAAAAQLGVYEEARVMIQSGIYQSGSSPEIDAAIAGREALLDFLQQRPDDPSTFGDAVRRLEALAHRGGLHG